ncbi:SPAC16E8.02, partial [Cucurbita argyrosperma subsp. argyrosperma]
MGKTGLFDLERHFAFYGAYHSNPVNIFIHVLFVWPIFFTTLAGSNAALPCLICWVGESILAFRLGYSQTWKIVLTAQLFCWTNQLIDHGVFEKRAPALLDNLAQPFLMAPFFVFFEVFLLWLFGELLVGVDIEATLLFLMFGVRFFKVCSNMNHTQDLVRVCKRR